jgi:hypothetical protein
VTTWKLFLDDERYPSQDGWTIRRSSYDAIEAVKEQGMPIEIAFDHDLGIAVYDGGEYNDTSMIFIRWVIDQHYEHGLVIPEGFKYSIHSQNPIGAANIRGLMDGFLNDIRNE